MDALKIAAALAVPLLFANAKKQATLVIKQGKREVHREKITAKDKRLFKVKLPNAYTAEIVVADGKAWVKRMPSRICPKHICSDMGKIGFDDNKKLVCVPNQLVVYFEKG